MTHASSDTYQGDACGLVDEFRAGHRHPVEEMRASIAAAEANKKAGLNAFSFIDPERALVAAARADVDLPFGGVPLAVKELESVAGWPDTEASVAFANRRGSHTSLQVERLTREGGMIPYAMTTASEFGGVNVTRTLLNGSTHNPWQHGRTPGGSSGGSAAAVAGGLCTIATAGDGGGSIRIPAGFCGLVGLKSTYGRIPRAPMHYLGNLTVSTGCVSRSIRDTARWFDIANGHDARDPLSLPRVSGWEDELGEDAADWLIRTTGMRRVDDVDTKLPSMGAAWSISGMISIREELGDLWPGCADDLTPEIRMGLQFTEGLYGSQARHKIETRRGALNERMAEIFRNVDIVMTASNPDVAFAADGPLPDTFGGIVAGANNNGRLTFPANLHGNPAISVPAGTVDGLPVGLQIVGKHFQEQVLLEIGLAMERGRPWPCVAPLAR